MLFDRASSDSKKRTVAAALSSEAEIERYFGFEVLDHSDGAIDLSRANGAPLLMDHDDTDQVGVVEKVFVGDDRKLRATLRFSSSQRASEIWQDVQDGIRTSLSVGYRINEMGKTGRKGEKDVYTATRWQVLEASIVSIPADSTVGIGRKNEVEDHEITVKPNMRILMNPDASDGGTGASAAATQSSNNTAANQADAVRSERLRSAEIRRLAKTTNNDQVMQMGETAVESGTSVEDFRKQAFETVCRTAKPITSPQTNVGMSDREIGHYSIVRALNRMANGKPVDGLEGEASAAMEKLTGRSAQGIFLPHELMTSKRALNVTTSADGGALVATNLLGGSLIELLRAKSVVASLGALTLSGLQGNVAIPKVLSGASTYWLSEVAEVTATTAQFGQVALTPHRLCAATVVSKQLLVQSSVDVESFVRNDLITAIALERDRASLLGTGADAEPLGVINTPTGLATAVTFAVPATPTFKEMVDFETNLSTGNADVGSLAYLVHPTARGRLKTTATATNSGIFIWNGNQINGYRAVASNQMDTTKNVMFGNWSDLIQADWLGIDLMVDPYSLSTTGQVRVIATIMVDNAVRHAASFCVSANAVA
jgi:HK97 family phage major capsid protein/HK97 family phage prohead protease